MRYSYSDPTANTAIANVDRERRREEKRRKLLEQKAYEQYLRELERGAGQTPAVGKGVKKQQI